jgi:hypothetical protein
VEVVPTSEEDSVLPKFDPVRLALLVLTSLDPQAGGDY